MRHNAAVHKQFKNMSQECATVSKQFSGMMQTEQEQAAAWWEEHRAAHKQQLAEVRGQLQTALQEGRTTQEALQVLQLEAKQQVHGLMRFLSPLRRLMSTSLMRMTASHGWHRVASFVPLGVGLKTEVDTSWEMTSSLGSALQTCACNLHAERPSVLVWQGDAALVCIHKSFTVFCRMSSCPERTLWMNLDACTLQLAFMNPSNSSR